MAAWTADAAVRVDTSYDDNVRLSADNEDDAIVTTADAKGEIRQLTENSEISAVAGVIYLDYSGVEDDVLQDDLPAEDIEYADLRAHWTGERITWSLDGSVRRDLLLETVGFIRDPLAVGAGGENSGSNAGEDLSTGGTIDQGSVEQQIRRYASSINPSFDYHLSERSRARLGYTYARVDYNNGLRAGLQDSQSNLLALDLERDMSEVDTVRLTTRAGQFDPDIDPKTDAYEMTVGWVRQFSESSNGSIDVGANHTDEDGRGDNGFVIRVRGFRTTELGSMYLQAERQLTPSGFGELVETDRLQFGYATRLSENVGLTLTGDAYSTRAQNEFDRRDDRDYVSLGPEVKWLFTPDFSLGARYRYRWVDRRDDPGSATGNVFGIFIAYQPQREI
jgi:hypothetical protein